MTLIANLVISTLAVFLAAYLLPGIEVSGIVGAFIVAIVLGVVNTFIRPLVLFFTLPLNLITLGLFTFVINAGLVLFVDWVVPDFYVANFWWALGFSLAMWVLNSFFHILTQDR